MTSGRKNINPLKSLIIVSVIGIVVFLFVYSKSNSLSIALLAGLTPFLCGCHTIIAGFYVLWKDRRKSP